MIGQAGEPMRITGWRQTLLWKWHRSRNTLREWAISDGEGHPPNNWAMSAAHEAKSGGCFGTYRAVFLNDASAIGVSIKHAPDDEQWALMVPAPIFGRLALWYLGRWAFGEWFGLRRALYYRWLHWHVGRMKRMRGLR